MRIKGRNIKRFIRILSFVFALLFCFLCVSACARNNDENSGNKTEDEDSMLNTNETESKSISDFSYPEKTGFSFKAVVKNPNAKKGENLVVECCLKNDTEHEFFIEHGEETITYSVGDYSETILAIAVLDTIKPRGEIKRTLNIENGAAEKVTVKASFYVMPQRYSDERREYTYIENIDLSAK